MAFDINVNKRNIQRLNIAEGGGFVNFASNINRAETVDDKIFIIASGGIGGHAISKLKSEIYKRFKIEDNQEKPKNIEFLYLDSDKDDLTKRCAKDVNGIGLNSDDTCQIFDTAAASIFKTDNYYEQLTDYQKKWFNETLSPVLTGNGAGGIRQASRYLMTADGALGEIINKIKIKFNYLLEDGILPDSKIRVFLIAGIGGGTGSGSFIDLAYIIRELINEMLIDPAKLSITGCLFLPDVYEVENDATKQRVKGNGYAALKELDYFMNIENLEDAKFDMEYNAAFRIRNTKTNVFDNCVLMTGCKAQAGAVVHSEVASINAVTDFIIDLITKTQKNNNRFMIQSFLDNKIDIQTAINKLTGQPLNANFSYMAVGASSVSLPFEQITCYLGYKTMQRVCNLWNREPNAGEITSLINNVGLLPGKQIGTMRAKGTGYIPTASAKNFSKDDMKNGTIESRVRNEIMSQNAKVFNSYDNIRQEIVSDILKNYSKFEDTSIKDVNKGPNYIFKALNGFVQDGKHTINGLINRIETELKNDVQKYKNGCEDDISQRELEKNKLKSKKNLFGIGDSKDVEEYLKCCYEIEMKKHGDMYMYKKIDETLDEVVKHLKNRANNYFHGYKESIEEILKVLKGNYDIIMNSEQAEHIFGNSLVDLSKNDENNARLKRLLDNEINSKSDLTLVTDFADTLLNNKQEWTSMDSNIYNPGKSLVAFIEKTYSNLLGKTVEEFLADYYDTRFGNEVAKICQTLDSDSDVFFKSQLAFSLGQLVSNKSAAIPPTAAQFKNTIQGLGLTTYDSSDKNKINIIKCYAGIPLYAMQNIESYEEAYIQSKSLHKGIHLNEACNNYSEFPSLHVKKYYSSNYKNEFEDNILSEINDTVDKMIKEELIDNSFAAKVIYDFECDDEKIKSFIESYEDNKNIGEDGFYKTKMYLLDAFASDYNIKIHKKSIMPKDSYLSNTVEDIKLAARMNWHLYKNIKATLEIYDKLKLGVEGLNEKIIIGKERENAIKLFKKCIDLGLILKKGAFWIYYLNLEDTYTFAKTVTFEKIDRDYEMFTCFNKFYEESTESQRDMLQKLYDHKLDDPNIDIDAITKIKDEIVKDAEEKVEYLTTFEAQTYFDSKNKGELRKEILEFYKYILEL